MSYINGKTHHKISNENLVDELEAMIRQKVKDKEAALAVAQAAPATGNREASSATDQRKQA